MKDKFFIDTNIIIYSYSSNEEEKQTIANNLFFNNDNLCISTQVISELSNVLFKKFKLSGDAIEDAVLEIDNIFKVCPFYLSTQLKAIRIKEKYKLQYYDSLIIANALENRGTILFTEDMQHNLVIENQLVIKNPFLEI